MICGHKSAYCLIKSFVRAIKRVRFNRKEERSMLPTYRIHEIPLLSVRDVAHLYRELSPGKQIELSEDVLAGYPEKFVLFGASEIRDSSDNSGSTIVSMATLAFVHTGAKRFGQVHDVVTMESHRGRRPGRNMSLAEEILRLIEDRARKEGLVFLELTSRPSRAAANHRYVGLGYKLVSVAPDEEGTNLYRLYL